MNKILLWGSVLLGVTFVVVALIYFVTPAGSLPAMMPGFATSSVAHHYKHGLGSLILGIALFAFAWFKSAPAKSA